ncbi:hypothetical protein SNEBB_009005 [Seison nebaliae]|nr:hypothetical protein SNEBB_009005 [Seison nebaliae]
MTTVAASAPDIAQFETYSLNDDQDDRTELIAGQDFDTIDEPIKATIMRDIRAIGQKITHVIFPRSNSTLLRDWDLWGPLFICIILSLLLKGYSDSHVDGNGNRLKTIGTAPEFAQIFLLIIIGSFTVTLNTSLLGGSISFFQSVCALVQLFSSSLKSLLLSSHSFGPFTPVQSSSPIPSKKNDDYSSFIPFGSSTSLSVGSFYPNHKLCENI